MFEVGKLTDESLDSFLGELEKASLIFFHFLANESTVLFARSTLILSL